MLKRPAVSLVSMAEKRVSDVSDALPSYMTVRQPVQPARMDKQKHSKLGAWVSIGRVASSIALFHLYTHTGASTNIRSHIAGFA